jgi:predicted ATPase
MILTLAVSGYRSIRNLVLPLQRLNVVTGSNGTGKSSLYRALRLLANVAQERAIGSLALEGGLQSTLWEGPAFVSRAVSAHVRLFRGQKTGQLVCYFFIERLGIISLHRSRAAACAVKVQGAAPRCRLR